MRISHWTLYFAAWLIAVISMSGSLFFSEVMEFPPCILCWYQRIAMYPLTLLLLVPLIKNINNTPYFTLPLIFVGWIIALYHNLLHYEIVPETASPCTEELSCSTVYLDLLGFITIPLMSFVAFTLILLIFIKIIKDLSDEK